MVTEIIKSDTFRITVTQEASVPGFGSQDNSMDDTIVVCKGKEDKIEDGDVV